MDIDCYKLLEVMRYIILKVGRGVIKYSFVDKLGKGLG